MDWNDYKREFWENLDEGEATCKGMKLALNTALEQQDIDNALRLYYTIIDYSYFTMGGFESILLFPEYISLFEKHPEYQDKHKEKFMWAYKWIIGDVSEFYQISMDKIVYFYTEYDKLCSRFNYNKRSYYRAMWNLLYDYGIEDFLGNSNASECHKKMMKCPLDRLSEIPAGECDDAVKYLLFVEDDIQKALEMAKPIFSGKLHCAQVPHYTYTNFAVYYFEHGDLPHAKEYAEKAIRIINRDSSSIPALVNYKGLCIMIMSYINVTKALQMFKKHFPVCCSTKSAYEGFYLYLGAYHLMKQLEKSGQKSVKFRFPFKDKSFYKESGIYSVSELKSYMYDSVKFYADKFDERNGNVFFNKKLQKVPYFYK